MTQLLMPHATAVWLVDNTALTFRQISRFCELHPLEVQAIANDEVATHIVGQDPILSGQLSREEIARCEADPEADLRLRPRVDLPRTKPAVNKGRYTPIAKRQSKPDAIAYLLAHSPQLSDAQLVRLIGTTKRTVEQVRDGSHRNADRIAPRDPVELGLCGADELSAEIEKADARKQSKDRALAKARAELARREAGTAGEPGAP